MWIIQSVFNYSVHLLLIFYEPVCTAFQSALRNLKHYDHFYKPFWFTNLSCLLAASQPSCTEQSVSKEGEYKCEY